MDSFGKISFPRFQVAKEIALSRGLNHGTSLNNGEAARIGLGRVKTAKECFTWDLETRGLQFPRNCILYISTCIFLASDSRTLI